MSNVINLEEFRSKLKGDHEWEQELDEGISLAKICFEHEACCFIRAKTSETTIFLAWVRFCDIDTDTSFLALFESEEDADGPYFCEYILVEEGVDSLQPYQLNPLYEQHGQWIDYVKPIFPAGTSFQTSQVECGVAE